MSYVTFLGQRKIELHNDSRALATITPIVLSFESLFHGKKPQKVAERGGGGWEIKLGGRGVCWV